MVDLYQSSLFSNLKVPTRLFTGSSKERKEHDVFTSLFVSHAQSCSNSRHIPAEGFIPLTDNWWKLHTKNCSNERKVMKKKTAG